jgi:hypothetical protein
MNKAGIGLAAALLLFVVIIAVVLAIFFLPIGTGYKVATKGTGSYDVLTGWHVSFNTATSTEDTHIFATQPGLWFWDTGGIVIEVLVGEYSGEVNVGSVSSWVGGSQPWTVYLRHVEPGSYGGTINLYEIVGGFFGFGGTKTPRTSTPFTFVVP